MLTSKALEIFSLPRPLPTEKLHNMPENGDQISSSKDPGLSAPPGADNLPQQASNSAPIQQGQDPHLSTAEYRSPPSSVYCLEPEEEPSTPRPPPRNDLWHDDFEESLTLSPIWYSFEELAEKLRPLKPLESPQKPLESPLKPLESHLKPLETLRVEYRRVLTLQAASIQIAGDEIDLKPKNGCPGIPMALVLPEGMGCLTLYTSRRVRLVIDVSDSRFFNWELVGRSQDTLQLRAHRECVSVDKVEAKVAGRTKNFWEGYRWVTAGFGEFPFLARSGKPWAGLVVEARGVGGERAVGEFARSLERTIRTAGSGRAIAIRTDPEPTEWRKPPASTDSESRRRTEVLAVYGSTPSVASAIPAKPPQGAPKKLSLAEYSALQRSKANAKSKVVRPLSCKAASKKADPMTVQNPLQPPPAVNSEGNDDSKMQPSRQAYPPNKLAQASDRKPAQTTDWKPAQASDQKRERSPNNNLYSRSYTLDDERPPKRPRHRNDQNRDRYMPNYSGKDNQQGESNVGPLDRDVLNNRGRRRAGRDDRRFRTRPRSKDPGIPARDSQDSRDWGARPRDRYHDSSRPWPPYGYEENMGMRRSRSPDRRGPHTSPSFGRPTGPISHGAYGSREAPEKTTSASQDSIVFPQTNLEHPQPQRPMGQNRREAAKGAESRRHVDETALDEYIASKSWRR
ncbi:hypothetical protein FN846DRAFT_1013400 [Sphaerosporella brunnea]|uniref:Uncharacterized protein n=1 Tax=Sphaerosporella brunnea TaxID=1250544 RepID=A0A5J5EXC5_9PEZI|nr:hypothetical protein FN846DRAFT_1013400 [Sphaerosporella brunnea]